MFFNEDKDTIWVDGESLRDTLMDSFGDEYCESEEDWIYENYDKDDLVRAIIREEADDILSNARDSVSEDYWYAVREDLDGIDAGESYQADDGSEFYNAPHSYISIDFEHHPQGDVFWWEDGGSVASTLPELLL